MIQPEFMPINDDINGIVKIPLSKSTENDERSGAITPGGINTIKNIFFDKLHGRPESWAELCFDSDSEDESQETEQKSDFKDKSEETQQKSESVQTKLEKLQNNYQSISGFLDESRIPTDDNFSKILAHLIAAMFFRYFKPFCEYRSFRKEIKDFYDFPQNKISNKKKCKNIDENKVIFKEFIPIFNAILKLVKNAMHIPCSESKILEFQIDLENESKNIDCAVWRRCVALAFLIECYHLIMIFLHQKVEKNPTHILKFVQFGNFEIIAIENPDFPYEDELNKLLKTFDTLKSNTNLRLFVSIYYQIKDDLEKIMEQANLEFLKNK